MSAEPYLDKAWLHDLGLAEGVPSLVYPELLDDGKYANVTLEDGVVLPNTCTRCDGDFDSLYRGPEWQNVCGECNDDLYNEWNSQFGRVCPRCGLREVDEGICWACEEYRVSG